MTRVRWSVGRITGVRGAGLGNEMIAWAKAYIGAEVLGARLVDPPWSINPRPYRSELGSSRTDALPYAAALALPGFEVGSDAVEGSSLVDYWDVCESLRPAIEAAGKPVLVHGSGMSGGFLGIRRARAFLRGRLFTRPEVAAAGLAFEGARAESLVVGVHARAGDFLPGTLAPGNWNIRTPVAWQADCVAALAERSPVPLTVVVCADEGAASLADDLRRRLAPQHQVTSGGGSALADLARLTWSDVVIPSVSSYSMAALFLGDALYAWPAWQLTERDGLLGIWAGKGATSLERPPGEVARGLPQGAAPEWPDWAVEHLAQRVRLRSEGTDLILRGTVPGSASEAPA